MEYIKNVKDSTIFKADKPILIVFDIAETQKVYCEQRKNIVVINNFYTISFHY